MPQIAQTDLPTTTSAGAPTSPPFASPASTAQGRALVTGASSGIGAAIAREYARRGKPLVLTARRVERLEALATELRGLVPCDVIAADLADPTAPAALFATTQARGLFVDTLVNNAGYGVPGRFLSADWPVHRDFLQVMVTAVAELTHLYLPAMEAAGRGRVLNVASLAGLVPASAGHTLYGATKAWLIRFSECLALESAPRGVHVTALCPGFTYTEFHDVNGMRATVSRLPRFLWLDSDQVARLGVDAVEAGHVRVVTGTANRIVAWICRYLPDPLVRAIVGSRSRDFRDAD
jgi:short-subunit dehydrogenase